MTAISTTMADEACDRDVSYTSYSDKSTAPDLQLEEGLKILQKSPFLDAGIPLEPNRVSTKGEWSYEQHAV
jgi:hypothetical protein